METSGWEATLAIRVQRRRGARRVPVGAFPPRTVGAGSSSLGLRLAGLGPGTYRLRATGAGTRVAAFTVR